MKSFRFIYKDMKNNENVFLGEIYNNRLVKYIDLKSKLDGNIYRARVKSFSKAMDAYILDIGLAKDAILKKNQRISDIKLGDQIIVELIKTSYDSKMHEVTQKITISDGYIVLLPYAISKSRNLELTMKYPFAKRTRAKELSDDMIKAHYDKLELEFKELLKEKNYLPTPKLLRSDKFLNEFILDYSKDIISNTNISNKITNINEDFNPYLDGLISSEISNMSNDIIELNNGNIVINQLEALTVIDINTGYTGNYTNKETMSFEVNKEAIEEIAIQISLREIKKMLIIDLLRMNRVNSETIIEHIKDVFNQLNLEYKILGFSNLGFLELLIF